MTIFVATDLSEHSDVALMSAHEVAERRGDDLVVCYVIAHPVAFYAPLAGVSQAVIPEVAADREQTRRDVARRVAKVTGRSADSVNVQVLTGTPYVEIVDCAARLEADLVVVARRGATGLERAFLGSVSKRVVRNAQSSVLVARSSRSEGPVLVATDFSDASVAAIKHGGEEARRHRCALILLHVVDILPPAAAAGLTPIGGAPIIPDEQTVSSIREAARATLATLTEGVDVQVDCRVEVGQAARTIVETAQEVGARMIVVAARGHTLLRRVTLGSVAERVIRDAECSVLAVR